MRQKLRRDQEKLDGVLIARLQSRSTGKLVGWYYRWNTGDVDPLWIDGPVEDVVSVPLPNILNTRDDDC